MRKSATALLTISLTAATVATAQTTPMTYEIYNKASGLALTNANYATANGYSIVQEGDDQGADVRWQITPVGGYFRITNQASGLALVDAGYSKNNGHTIGQWTYDGGTDALWQITSLGNGYYQLVNLASGLSLVDAGYVTTPGYSIAQWSYDGGSDAQWLLKAVAGGSDYAWYQLSGCTREPYGVVYNYNTATATINAQLQQMYNAGQRRIKVPIYFGHGLNTGTVMDSTGGALQPQFMANLTNLLAEIKAIGFQEVEIGMYPVGENAVLNNMTNWSTWNEPLFQETWNLIYNLHPIFAASGIPYQIDLLNEGMPTKYLQNYAVSLEFDQKLWNYYVYTFGKSDTVGFSIIPSSDRFSEVPNVYGNSSFGSHGYPNIYDLHIYANASTAITMAYDAFNSQGYNPPWIIGESYYNDAQESSELISGIQATHHPILALYQWPLTRQAACSDVDTAPPTSFNNYGNSGF